MHGTLSTALRRWPVLVLAVAIMAASAGVALAGVGSWGPARGPYGGDIDNLLVDPQTPSTLYATAFSGGIFKSTDSGADWARIGFPGEIIDGLVQAPNAPQTLYAAVFLEGVWKTSDGGRTWQRAGLKDTDVSTLAADPSNPQIVYAGMSAYSDVHGLFETTDGGATWKQAGITDKAELSDLQVDPSNPSLLYTISGGKSLLTSHDAGATWSVVTMPPASAIGALALDPVHSGTVYVAAATGQVFGTSDGGLTWRTLAVPPSPIDALRVEPGSSQVLYAGTEASGVLESPDGGLTWQELGPEDESVSAVVPDPSDPLRIFAGSGRGVFRTDDHGANWALEVTGMVATNVRSIAVDPKHPQTVYAIVDGLLKSVDGARTWVETGPAGEAIITVVLGRKALLAGTVDGLFTSRNRGATWQASGLSGKLIDVIATSPTSEVIYAGTDGQGAFVSFDGGGSWRQAGLARRRIVGLAVSPRNPRVAIASFRVQRGTKVAETTNGGKTWQAVRTPSAKDTLSGLTIDAHNPDVVYACGFSGAYKGSLSGRALTALGELPDGAFDVVSLVVDPRRRGVLYAGTLLDGIFRSSNGGRTWQHFDKGLTNPSINEIAMDGAGRVLYAATWGGGVFDYRFG
jgi:photosystem II stability/assembly factor-like uncharacterized protein